MKPPNPRYGSTKRSSPPSSSKSKSKSKSKNKPAQISDEEDSGEQQQQQQLQQLKARPLVAVKPANPPQPLGAILSMAASTSRSSTHQRSSHGGGGHRHHHHHHGRQALIQHVLESKWRITATVPHCGGSCHRVITQPSAT